MITCSDDGVCPCACNYAVDASCTCRDLAGAIIVTITRPPVVAVYRMKGIRSADFRPYEEVIYMQTTVTIVHWSWSSNLQAGEFNTRFQQEVAAAVGTVANISRSMKKGMKFKIIYTIPTARC